MNFSSLKKLVSLSITVFLFTACGGEPVGEASRSDGGTNVSFRPLSVFYEDQDGFETYFYDGLIGSFLINPVDKSSGTALSNVRVDDYKVTIDEVSIDPNESFPLFQRIIGEDVFLTNTLIFDLSGSVVNVDKSALIAEAKNYIAQVQNHSNPFISGQYISIWAFADSAQQIVGFVPASDTASLENALDQVALMADPFNPQYLGQNSNLHGAIINAMGGFDTGMGIILPSPVQFPGYQDPVAAVDFATKDGIQLTQATVFSSGPDTFLEYLPEDMESSLRWQSFVQYESGGSGATNNLKRPVFYYVVGGQQSGDRYELLAENAEVTSGLVLSNGSYNFANGLIQRQISAVNRRVNFGSQYTYRYALIPRFGTHDIVFTSNNSDGSIFSFLLNIDIPTFLADNPMLSSVLLPEIEITGPNNTYISNSDIALSEAATFTAATRWTTDVYDASDYSWTLSGGAGTTNANGSFTVNSIAGASATLTLTNNVIGDSATITITN